jgi:NIMA-interacting peptidyl-prolyl cis-trans isomerase 1
VQQQQPKPQRRARRTGARRRNLVSSESRSANFSLHVALRAHATLARTRYVARYACTLRPFPAEVALVVNMAYRASHLLIKYNGSARKASWRDPDGSAITLRKYADAAATLTSFLQQLSVFDGEDRVRKFDALAHEHSDCGSAKQCGDLGELEPGEMMEEFEDAVQALAVGQLSGIVQTDSGLHIILRTPLDRPVCDPSAPPPQPPGPAPAELGTLAEPQPAPAATAAPTQMTEPYRAAHVLIKHSGSARCASWRDPDGTQIKQRTKSQAQTKLVEMRRELSTLEAPELYERFAALARVESDCASAKSGGDLGVLEPGEMMEEFEEAMVLVKEGTLSPLVDSESGMHLVVRVPLSGLDCMQQQAGAATQPAAALKYRASHILIKHAGSAQCESWRDPSGDQIRTRSQDMAINQLVGLMAELSQYHGAELLERFDEIAHEVSDCGTEAIGGVADTGVCEQGDMDNRFEGAVMTLSIGEVSGVVLTDSGAHIILRTATDHPAPAAASEPPPALAPTAAAAAAAAAAPAASPAPASAPAPALAPVPAPGPAISAALPPASVDEAPAQHHHRSLHSLAPKVGISRASGLASAATSMLKMPPQARNLGWPGLVAEGSALHTRLGERIRPGRSSARLLDEVVYLCGDTSSVMQSPVYVQDGEGRFACEVARVNPAVPASVVEQLVRFNPTAERYHRLVVAIQQQEWVQCMGIIQDYPATTTICDKEQRRAMQLALLHGAPTRFLEIVANACPADSVLAEEESRRRTMLATMAAGVTRLAVDHFMERVCSQLAREEAEPWNAFYRYASSCPAQERWWSNLSPHGIEGAAHRKGMDAAAKLGTTPSEQEEEYERVRTITLQHDTRLLKILCERGATRPTEMKHCLDLDLTGVDDAERFWQPMNVRSALNVETGEPFVTALFASGLRPIQWAMRCRAPLECVEILLEEHDKLELPATPDGVEMVDVEDKTLVHLAAEAGCTVDVVQKMVSVFPGAVKRQDMHGRFPVQLLLDCIRKCQQQREGALSQRWLSELQKSLSYLDELYPPARRNSSMLRAVGGPKAYFNGGGTKASHEEDWAEAQRVLSNCPETAKFSDNMKMLPLHHAVQKGAPVNFVRALLEAFPQGVRCRDKDRRLCLHCVRACTPFAVVQLLLDAHRGAAAETDINGRLPLMHFIKEGGCRDDPYRAAKAIEKATVRGLGRDSPLEEAHDERGKTILHFFSKSTHAKVGTFLAQQYEGALKTQDHSCKFPVQIAIAQRAPRAVVNAMVEGFPTAKRCHDLWEACRGGDWDEVVRIADECPAAVRVPASGGVPPADFGECLCVRPSIHPSVRPSVRLSVCLLSVCPS